MASTMSGSNDERAQVLRMVEDGTLSAADAIKLLDRLGKAGMPVNVAGDDAGDYPAPELGDVPEAEFAQAGLPPLQPTAHNGGKPQWLRVRVTDLATGRSKTSVSIPFGLASWGLRIGSRFTPNVEGVDLVELSRMVDEGGMNGMLVDVVDEEDGEHVQVFVE